MRMPGTGVFESNCFAMPCRHYLLNKLVQVNESVSRRSTGLVLCVLALTGCGSATPEVPVLEAQSQHWSFSQTVQTDNAMITLFDPADLSHHEVEPDDWYRYDFAFSNDLETGRFVAVLTDRPGTFDVRLTSGPLSADERQTAGPRAAMRLRVIDNRLLLAGGDAWPSESMSSTALTNDARWIGLDNGDYEVIITVLDRNQLAQHDFVMQLLPVEDIALVPYAPGIPQLIVGEPAAVAGINAGGLGYDERCSGVPEKAAWSPLTSLKMPMPGKVATVDLSENLRYRANDMDAINAGLPIVIARMPTAGSIGVFIKPSTWQSDATVVRGEVSVTTRVLCAVRITSVVPGVNAFELNIEPLPGARDSLGDELSNELVASFEAWITQISDPAWRYKSAQIQRTRSDRAKILGIMEYLNMNAKFSESMLGETNNVNAIRLLDRMSDASRDRQR